LSANEAYQVEEGSFIERVRKISAYQMSPDSYSSKPSQERPWWHTRTSRCCLARALLLPLPWL